ncbi:MAG: hypothetical protein R3B90_05185 [Planctomycetaceae bacterium]
MSQGPCRCPACGEVWEASTTSAFAPAGGVDEVVRVADSAHAAELEQSVTAEGGVAAAASADVTARGGLLQGLLYGLSLPERVVRGAVGLTAGAARELAEFVVPQAFKDSASYKIAIENSLGFLTETIGGVSRKPGEMPAEAAEASEHVARKAVGNFVDLAGLATLHVSPMWLLAVVSDVAYGTKSYTLELARELKEQGVIDDTSTIHHVDDVLSAIQRTCGTAASTFDQPPLSVDELRKVIDETRVSLSQADVRRLIPEAELRQYWSEMRDVAATEQVSLLGVSGAIAMQTLGKVKTAGSGTLIGVRVAGGLLHRNVIGHYQDAAPGAFMSKASTTPCAVVRAYIAAVWNNFSSERKSWTESLLDPAHLSGWFGKVSGMFSPAAVAPPDADPPHRPTGE